MKGVYDMNQLHRRMGTFSLMMVGLGSMIGSGWLFGAWRAAQIAGPAAIISWVIGMVVILFIALSYSELGSMFPEAGEWSNTRNIHTVRLSVLLRAGPTGLRLCPSFRLKRWPPFNI